MRNAKREIECLMQLQQRTSTYEELITFLHRERLISNEELRIIRNEVPSEKAKQLQAHLARLSADRKLQLLEYEWTILPVERIRITIVTDSVQKEILSEGTT